MGVTVDLTREPLTDDEQRRVEAARREGVLFDQTVHGWAKEERGRILSELNEFRRAWEGLSEEARNIVPNVGDQINERLSMIAHRRPPDAPGLAPMVSALAQIWVERGGQFVVSDIRKLADDGSGAKYMSRASPMCEFVAHHALTLFPKMIAGRRDASTRWPEALYTVTRLLRSHRQENYEAMPKQS